MKKFVAAVALMLVSVVAIQAAPTLGVTWRAPANAKSPGVKILTVAEASNAEELGLQVGDMVLAINDQLVRTGPDATAAVAKAKGKLTLLVKDINSGDLVEIKADIDEPTQGFAANPNAKAKYKNIVRMKK